MGSVKRTYNELAESPLHMTLGSLIPPSSQAKLRKVAGAELLGQQQDGHLYECSRYVWRNKRADCAIEQDRKFSSKRMALLYVAKMNSESVKTYMSESGKRWTDLCSDSGIHALSPNMPFALDSFVELPDDVLERYGEGVGRTLTVRKAPQGSIYSFRAVPLATTEVEELWRILES